ncbi:hypothetical protein ZWY2020_046207 [Hordeum vulgare]|nr:hypothetical protein ZWY2020_046207 [Hordeum vulgare]
MGAQQFSVGFPALSRGSTSHTASASLPPDANLSSIHPSPRRSVLLRRAAPRRRRQPPAASLRRPLQHPPPARARVSVQHARQGQRLFPPAGPPPPPPISGFINIDN